jgi:hypothetical protein
LLRFTAVAAGLAAVLAAGRVNITQLEMRQQQIQVAAVVAVALVRLATILVVTAVQPVGMLKN